MRSCSRSRLPATERHRESAVTGGRRRLPLAITSAGLLAWSNLVVPALPPATGVRALVNVAGTVGLVLRRARPG